MTTTKEIVFRGGDEASGRVVPRDDEIKSTLDVKQ